MICIRCGKAEIATEDVFVVSHDPNPDLDAVIDAALRTHGIDGVNGLGQLCPRCWDVAHLAIDAGARDYFSTRRDVIEYHSQKNLGRPLTSAERDEINAYLDGVHGKRGSSSPPA